VPQLRESGTRLDLAKLVDALEARQAASGVSFRQLAAELGLAPSTLTRVRQGHRPDAEALAVLMVSLGLDPKELLSPDDPAVVRPLVGRRRRRITR
jgi:transcriptional regulator with XRE-family HTH domain